MSRRGPAPAPTVASDAARALSIWRTLRRAVAAWWDHLGLACAMSAYAVVAVAGSLGMAGALAMQGAAPSAPRALRVIPGVLLVALVTAFTTGGLHRAAHAIVHRDEPALARLLPANRRDLAQWIGLGAIQAAVALACLLNIWFYLRWRSHAGTILAALFGYALAMWLVNCLYHWPLMVSAQAGLIPSEGERGPSLRAVFRNGAILFAASPVYAAGLAALVIALSGPLVVSGIGLMLVAPALTAIIGTQALREHLVRLGSLPPPDESPVPADQWRVPDPEVAAPSAPTPGCPQTEGRPNGPP